MPNPNPTLVKDLVSQAVLRSAQRTGSHPLPLIATSYEISIAGGLADILAVRKFHNSELHSIEATLTFPVPVNAVLYGLTARIGGRRLQAVSKAKSKARQDYESAIDTGHTAVLHEELIKGVHMLSVAHVAPGTDIEVTFRFAMPAAWIGNCARIRIPTTVGEIYGASPLADCDELLDGGALQAADITVTSPIGSAVVRGAAPLVDGKTRLPLDRPIDIQIHDWTPSRVTGCAADGRTVMIDVTPTPQLHGVLDAAILVDHSGSMQESCSTDIRLTKHAAVLLGLSEAAEDLRDDDRLNLWEFDDAAKDLGACKFSDFRSLVRTLSPPAGGTEIGKAIDEVLRQRPTRDIVLITDGKSHALCVQRLAQTGVRFTIVLIGDDSLEANVGHLAALSGGDIFIATGGDIGVAVRSALLALRKPRSDIEHSSTIVVRFCAGMKITVQWDNSGTAANVDVSPAVAAFAAHLLLPRLAEAEAAELAERENLVTHLTSLILVDTDGPTQQGLPQTRKIALPSPATRRFALTHQEMLNSNAVCEASHMMMKPAACGSARPVPPGAAPARTMRAAAVGATFMRKVLRSPSTGLAGASIPVGLRTLRGQINWRDEGMRLIDGILVGLPTHVADAIEATSRLRAIIKAARRHGLSPQCLAIGLLAYVEATHDRFADRVARAIVGNLKRRELGKLCELAGFYERGKAA